MDVDPQWRDGLERPVEEGDRVRALGGALHQILAAGRLDEVDVERAAGLQVLDDVADDLEGIHDVLEHVEAGDHVVRAAKRQVGAEAGLLQLDVRRSEEHTSELQSRLHLVCRLLLEKKKKTSKAI